MPIFLGPPKPMIWESRPPLTHFNLYLTSLTKKGANKLILLANKLVQVTEERKFSIKFDESRSIVNCEGG